MRNKYCRNLPKKDITLEDIFTIYEIKNRNIQESLRLLFEACGAKKSVRMMKDWTDVHGICDAFNIKGSAILHAVKKLMCVGIRGHKDEKTDLEEIISALSRAYNITMTEM